MPASTPPRSLGIAITHQPPVSAGPDDWLARLDRVEPTIGLATNERPGRSVPDDRNATSTSSSASTTTSTQQPGFVLYGHELYALPSRRDSLGGR